MSINAIDLFCGAGGLTHGLLRSGIKVSAGFDIDEACEWPYQANNGARYIRADISEVSGNDLARLWPKRGIRLLAGCAPCQPFSTYRQGGDAKADKKWRLLYEFGRLVADTKPELVTMENVPQLAKHKVFSDFRKLLERAGYHTWAEVVNCPDYGLAQKRQRLVLLASQLGPISLRPPTHSPDTYITVRDAIGHLPALKAGSAHPDDPLHCASGLSQLNLKRIKQSKPGGTWRDWDPDLVAKCHLKESGSTYAGVYGRMSWDAPAPTMTTLCYGYGNGRFGHPSQHRAISLREAAIFQSFPESYQFAPDEDSINFRTIGRMIGNAVPVRLGEVIGETLVAHTKQYKNI
ncbi:DNA cytosine methyltransferase [Burkholderia dolosa]|uniref:DNA cytosine methyltransferase n=1 Tax=Burkholderia dolosa TaxID=152500 RepID=UPI0020113737|nr:DNA cytosine methyltransferase [Burkholderia dolosa]